MPTLVRRAADWLLANRTLLITALLAFVLGAAML